MKKQYPKERARDKGTMYIEVTSDKKDIVLEKAMNKVISNNFKELLKPDQNRFTDPGNIKIVKKNKNKNKVKKWNNLFVFNRKELIEKRGFKKYIKHKKNYSVSPIPIEKTLEKEEAKMETKSRKKPRCKEAMEYVKAHVYMPVSDEEFIIIEKYAAEKHDSLFSDGGYLGDGDLIRYVCKKLTEAKMFIPQIKVEAIVRALYDFMFESGMLLPISSTFHFNELHKWDFSLSDAIHSFYVEYDIYPTFIFLSYHTKSQIDLINSETTKSKIYGENIAQFLYSDVIDNKVETCKVKFKIDESIPHKSYILLHKPDDNNE
jgi:hypothetical protein